MDGACTHHLGDLQALSLTVTVICLYSPGCSSKAMIGRAVGRLEDETCGNDVASLKDAREMLETSGTVTILQVEGRKNGQQSFG